MDANDYFPGAFNKVDFDLTGLTTGDYRIERRIGAGAMAEVWLARQCSLNRLVALKVLRQEAARDETCVRRFVYEAQAAAKLEHPNIVHIYEVGSFGAPLEISRGVTNSFLRCLLTPLSWLGKKRKNVCYYISEEYVDGLNLQQYLRQHGPLPIPQAFFVMFSIASALEKAAAMEIVHRDIKPENILLGSSGSVKIADFGLARLDHSAGRDDVTLTQIGMTLGTPLYMSPEQSRGEDLDFRSDIYSFGVTSWQLLTGQPPFRGETPLAVVLEHLHAPVPPIHDFRKDVPHGLARVLEKMLAKKPEDRFDSFSSLIDAIRSAQNEYLTEIPCDSDSDQYSCPEESDFGEFAFKDAMLTTAVSIELQTRFQDLGSVRSKGKKLFSYLRSVRFAVLLTLCLFLGGLTGLLLQKSSPVSILPTTAAAVERFSTVEEQWVFAAQLNTPEAWKSIVDYFPQEEYWTRKALQQLACVYVFENAVSRARPLFFRFADMPSSEPQYTTFGQAGLAWCLATEGNVDRAVAILSEIRSGRDSLFTPITEELISRTQDLIRNRKTVTTGD